MDGPMISGERHRRNRRLRHAATVAVLTVALIVLVAGAMQEHDSGPWTTGLVCSIIGVIGGWLASGAYDGIFEE